MIAVVMAVYALNMCDASGNGNSTKPYFRYWSGFKLDTLTEDEFRHGMDWFLNQTTWISPCGGLRTYIVTLLRGKEAPENIGSPDEIALLQYENETEYNMFYSTPLGKYYQGLHAKFFNMSISHSLVPVDYNGTSEAGTAFCIPNCTQDWNSMLASSSVFYGTKNATTDLSLYIKLTRTLPSVPVLVLGVYDTYVKQTAFWNSQNDRVLGMNLLRHLLTQTGYKLVAEVDVYNASPPFDVHWKTSINATIVRNDSHCNGAKN